jgi:NAD(P)-dependent dehydrogenase (short-subunit alcohol dehydrogenase family)
MNRSVATRDPEQTRARILDAATDLFVERGFSDVSMSRLAIAAGVTKSLGFFDVTEADWDRIYRVNAKGLFFCMQAAARRMVANRTSGRIVNVTSVHEHVPLENACAYCAAKGGLGLLTHTFELEEYRDAISVALSKRDRESIKVAFRRP